MARLKTCAKCKLKMTRVGKTRGMGYRCRNPRCEDGRKA